MRETHQTETPIFKFESVIEGLEEEGHVGLGLTREGGRPNGHDL